MSPGTTSRNLNAPPRRRVPVALESSRMSDAMVITRCGTVPVVHSSVDPTLNLSAAVIRSASRPLYGFTRSVLALLTLALTPVIASAQLTTGTINGRVTDEQGASMPGVTIEATNAETGFVRTDVTDGAGGYRLAALPVGRYTVGAELAGFQPVERVIVVNVGTTVGYDVTLRVAAVNERVDVQATATPLVSTRSSAVGEVVDLS